MTRRTRRLLLISATVFVWGAVGAASVGRFKLSARAQLSVELAVKPPAVKIAVDGERQFDGTYADTPLKLQLRPGHHRFRVSRDGYVTQVFQVDGDPGDELHLTQVVLERTQGQEFAEVEITADGTPAHVDVDDGLAHGETPLTLGDVTADREHTLTFYLRWPDKDLRYRCKFTAASPTADDEPQVYRIKAKIKGQKVKVTGCDRAKDKRK